jgi:GNAT superfamily N-acetyltransferase
MNTSPPFLPMNVRTVGTEEGKGHSVSDDRRTAVFVAFSDGKMIGFADIGSAGWSQSSDCAELYAIYPDPAHIGKGVGQSLFRACVERAKDHSIRAMTAKVLSRNSLARAFYERMQGAPVPSTEKLMAKGGTEEKVIAYRWSAATFQNW